MKKALFLSVFLIFLGFSNVQVELWLGPKAGVNIANISDVDSKSLTGIYAGAAFSIKFNERYALQPELGFSMQRSKDVEDSGENIKLYYFTVGVINNLYLLEGCHILTGPEFNFKINDTFSDLYDYNWDDDEDYYYDDNSDIQPFDFAIVAGV